jgi:hypothetical protein
MNASLTAGFNNWIEFDFPAFLDAISNSLETRTAMDMEFPEPARRIRRCLLGPVYDLASRDIETEEEHSFCPCCLLTNSFEAFRRHFTCCVIRLKSRQLGLVTVQVGDPPN